jgi:hypothetical protein
MGNRRDAALKAARKADALKSNKAKRTTSRTNFKSEAWYQTVYRDLAVSGAKNRELQG